MTSSASAPARPPGSAGGEFGPAGARRTLRLVLGALALLGILVAGGVAWSAVLGSSPEPEAADRDPDEFVPEIVAEASDPALADAPEPEADAAGEVEEAADPAAPDESPDQDPPADAEEPVDLGGEDLGGEDPGGEDPGVEDPGVAGPRVQPVPWLSLVPPAGSGWSFEVFAATGLPAFEGSQPPQGYLEVFVDDGYASLGEAVREIELDAAAFGATEIGRDQLEVPGVDAAVALLHSVPDASAPFDQGILLLEVADEARPLIVVMVMLSEGAGPTVFEIEETFASVAVDADALRGATAP